MHVSFPAPTSCNAMKTGHRGRTARCEPFGYVSSPSLPGRGVIMFMVEDDVLIGTAWPPAVISCEAVRPADQFAA